MAVVKRKKHPAPRPLAKLVRAVTAVLACLFAAVLLFQLDAFSKKHKHRAKNKSIPRVSYMNPELVAQQQQQQLRGAGLQQEQAAPQPKPADDKDLRIQNAGEEESLNKQEVQQQQREKPHSDNTRRRVEFTLSNLKDDGSDETATVVVVETNSEWAPLGVAHFWDLVEADYYQDCRFFRVVPNFVAQFGLAADPAVTAQYQKLAIQDDPVVESNQRGTLTYAMSGPNTRSTQLFFNFKDNHYLDGEGFAPIGRIIEGLDALEQINDRHRELPKQGQIVRRGNAYLEEEFADLTYISAVRILDNDNSKKQQGGDDDGEGDDDDNDESSPEQVG